MPIINMVYKKKKPLIYDFTKSDGGWIAGSGCLRNSNGFYRSGTSTDGDIYAPEEIYYAKPKKITLTYNKIGAASGTGFLTQGRPSGGHGAVFPRDNGMYLTVFELNNGTSYKTNLGQNPTGVVNWVCTIDTSTPNWTSTHQIGSLTPITDTYGIIKYLWDNKKLAIRIVNRTGNIYITGLKIEY